MKQSKSSDGLIPAIIQDDKTGVVLMLGYMNDESLAKTKELGLVTFFSRSKQRLWTKGETSGNTLAVKKILLDCDKDTYLIKATPAGPVCHTGDDTCFGEENSKTELSYFMDELGALIESRKAEPIEDSYTCQLFRKGIPKIAQKVGEEAVEVVIEALRTDNQDQFLNEAADLLFHLSVLLVERGTTFAEVVSILRERNSAA